MRVNNREQRNLLHESILGHFLVGKHKLVMNSQIKVLCLVHFCKRWFFLEAALKHS